MPVDIQTPYVGQPIVAKDSFFRRLPHVLEPSQKLRFEALVLSADTLEYAFQNMREVATRCGYQIDRVSSRDRTALLSSAWTIVDHLHAARQLIPHFFRDEPGPVTKAFLATTEVAQHFRNKMDHLNSNIGNLSKSKKLRTPLFGALSYFVTDEYRITSVGPELVNGYIMTIMAGSIFGGEHLPAVNPVGHGVAAPVDLFQLSGYGETLLLGTPLSMLSKILAGLEKDAETQIRIGVERLSAEKGIPVDELSGHHGGGLVVAVKVQFGPLAEADSPLGLSLTSASESGTPSLEPER